MAGIGIIKALLGGEPSLAEAQAGTSLTLRHWSAKRIADAIAALGGGGSPSFLNIGNATSAVDPGDLAAGVTGSLPGAFFDASAVTLNIGSAGSGTLTIIGSGANSEQFGAGATASINSTSCGNGATATGTTNGALAAGRQSTALENGVALGPNSTNTGAGATSTGQGSSAAADCTANGQGSVASGAFSSAYGQNSLGAGFGDAAFGRSCRLSNAGGANTGVGSGIACSGLSNVLVGMSITCAHNQCLVLGRGGFSTTANNQAVIGTFESQFTDFYLGTGIARDPGVGVVADITINGTSATTTADKAGASFTWATGKGTGDGPLATHTFQTTNQVGAGAGAQTLSDRLVIGLGVNSGAATDAVAPGDFASGDSTTGGLYYTAATGVLGLGLGSDVGLSLSAGSILGTDATTATTAGQAIEITAGDGATTGAGGALTMAGGAGGLTGAGGAVSLTSGAGGGTSGASGTAGLGTGASTSGNTGATTLGTGNAAAGNSGNIVADVGTASGTAGSVNLGGTNAAAVNIGRSGGNISLFGVAAVGQQASIATLTDNSGGTPGDTIAAITNAANAGSADVGPTADGIASNAAKINGILTILSNIGIMA